MSKAVTSKAVTSKAVTSKAVTSKAVTSKAVTSKAVTSKAVTSKAVALGIDAGSTTFKAVAIDRQGAIIDHVVELASPRIEEQAQQVLNALREQSGTAVDLPLGATGYGRKRVKASRVLTEITCHARGAFALADSGGVLVDIGGQDSKVIRIAKTGEVLDFAMNDKCAAGTGRFLEVILGRLGVSFDEVAGHIAQAKRAVPVSSTCTVFAESEVVSLVAQGADLPGILKGLHKSLASRVAALAGNLSNEQRVFMSGGVALNRAMVDALAAAMGSAVTVLPEPQLVGALGAALSVCP